MKVPIEDADRVKTGTVNTAGAIYVGNDLQGKQIRIAIEVLD